MKRHSDQSELSKLQIVASLFAASFGEDLYFARQIKDSIDAALPEDQREDISAFLSYAEQLASQTARQPLAEAISLVPAQEEEGFSILALRARLLAGLKKTCHSRQPLLVLTGLREAICPQGRRWTSRREREYHEAIAFARDFCNARSRPSSKLSLVIL